MGEVFEEQQYGIAVGPSAPSWLKEVLNRAILLTWKSEPYLEAELQWFGTDNQFGSGTAPVSNANQ